MGAQVENAVHTTPAHRSTPPDDDDVPGADDDGIAPEVDAGTPLGVDAPPAEEATARDAAAEVPWEAGAPDDEALLAPLVVGVPEVALTAVPVADDADGDVLVEASTDPDEAPWVLAVVALLDAGLADDEKGRRDDDEDGPGLPELPALEEVFPGLPVPASSSVSPVELQDIHPSERQHTSTQRRRNATKGPPEG